MNVSLNKRKENNVTIIDFIDDFGDKIGQLVFEIIDGRATIYDTFIYPDYRKKDILKNHLPTIISMMKQSGASIIELFVLSEEAKTAWAHLGFKESGPNCLIMKLE